MSSWTLALAVRRPSSGRPSALVHRGPNERASSISWPPRGRHAKHKYATALVGPSSIVPKQLDWYGAPTQGPAIAEGTTLIPVLVWGANSGAGHRGHNTHTTALVGPSFGTCPPRAERESKLNLVATSGPASCTCTGAKASQVKTARLPATRPPSLAVPTTARLIRACGGRYRQSRNRSSGQATRVVDCCVDFEICLSFVFFVVVVGVAGLLRGERRRRIMSKADARSERRMRTLAACGRRIMPMPIEWRTKKDHTLESENSTAWSVLLRSHSQIASGGGRTLQHGSGECHTSRKKTGPLVRARDHPARACNGEQR